MTFTPKQIEVLELLFKLSPKQRNRALQLAMIDPVPLPSNTLGTPQPKIARKSPAQNCTPVSTDSSLTGYSTGSERSEGSSGSASSGSAKRLHTKNRITRLATKLCKLYLNSQRMWDHLFSANNRMIDHRLESVLLKIKPALTHKGKRPCRSTMTI